MRHRYIAAQVHRTSYTTLILAFRALILKRMPASKELEAYTYLVGLNHLAGFEDDAVRYQRSAKSSRLIKTALILGL
jgi:hypothetical protein